MRPNNIPVTLCEARNKKFSASCVSFEVKELCVGIAFFKPDESRALSSPGPLVCDQTTIILEASRFCSRFDIPRVNISHW